MAMTLCELDDTATADRGCLDRKEIVLVVSDLHG